MSELYWIGIGDIHDDISMMSAIPGIEDAAGIIISGDLTNHGKENKARRIIDAALQLNPTVFAQYGNMDHAEVDAYLDAAGVNIHARCRALAPEKAPDIGIVGVGASTPTPFGTPSEFTDNILQQWLEQAGGQCSPFSSLLFVAHTPPLETATDQLSSGVHVGSAAVRAFIEQARPQVCLTGHIHESRAVDQLGATTIVNPGPLAGGGYALITLAQGALHAELKTLR